MKHRPTLILLVVGLLLNVFHEIDAGLSVIPRDTEVMVNDSTYMNCSTSLDAEKVQWRHGGKIVFTGRYILEPYNERYTVEVNSSSGTSNLIIRSAQPSDAGQYECSEDEVGAGEQRSAQLIVLDDDPVCTSNTHSSGVIGPNTCGIKPDDVKLSCSITYHGNILPVLQWKASGNNQSIIGLLNFTTNKNEVTYTLTMKSTLDLNNSSFSCQTTRASKRNYSCSSDVLRILYVFSSDDTMNLKMNDEISCFANTSQSCSYKWKWFSGDDSITVSNDQILKPNRAGLHRCEATCSLGNKLCTVDAMYAEVYSTLHVATSGHHLLPLWVVLALAVIGLLIGVVIYRCWKRHKYISDIVFVKKIRTKAAEEGKKLVKGLTILDKELFVVSERCSDLEVYDSMEFKFSHKLKLKELIDPKDIVSCKRNNCLYISNCKGQDQSSEILRVDPSGELKHKWSTEKDYGHLSVTDEANVLFVVFETNKLKEYLPDGQLKSEINLLSSIRQPLHAIKLANGHFVVSHGFHEDDLHRVCIVDGDGNLEKSFGGKRGSKDAQMDLPIYLAVDGNGFVMVADRWNKRLLLLDPDLGFGRQIILSKGNYSLRLISRFLLDQTNNRLLVAHNSILIYKFKN